MGLFDMFKKKEPEKPKTLPEDHGLHTEDFGVAGVQYHKAELKRLEISNPEYRASAKKNIEAGLTAKRIFRCAYVNKPVDLIPDHGVEAYRQHVMVKIAGEHVGYITDEDALHVREILKYGSVKYITARISGGDYKVVSTNGEAIKSSDYIRISVRIAYSV